jgi:hypothetical protein
VEYFASVAVSFLEKKARGRQPPFSYCCRTPPTCESEASVTREMEAMAAGCERLVALRRATLAASKAVVAAGDQASVLGVPLSKSVRGCRVRATPGRKRR